MRRSLQSVTRAAVGRRSCFTEPPKRAQLHAGWDEEGGALLRTFEFKTKSELWAFLGGVSKQAERAQHHPEWRYTEAAVTVKLTTHDAGNAVTVKDLDMALYMDKVSENSFETLPVGAVHESTRVYKKQCTDFVEAFALMQKISALDEHLHPSIFNVYNNIHVSLPRPLSGRVKKFADTLSELGFIID
ncbi:putative pterin-4-alpha-carbinolamine dehydratase [Diplonema papillatum]|nr:putative pterin-4-alpha-carbinolamine dehydratase [Diplonema papillatum]